MTVTFEEGRKVAKEIAEMGCRLNPEYAVQEVYGIDFLPEDLDREYWMEFCRGYRSYF